MKNYSSHTDLLSTQFQLVAHGWDSMVFLDRQDPAVILKLYDPLGHDAVTEYYRLQSDMAKQAWKIEDSDLEVSIVDPLTADDFSIISHEDGVLVTLPRITWENLQSYWSDTQRLEILSRVKSLLEQRGLPISGGFEVKPENIMVNNIPGEKLQLFLTDVWARVDECIQSHQNI